MDDENARGDGTLYYSLAIDYKYEHDSCKKFWYSNAKQITKIYFYLKSVFTFKMSSMNGEVYIYSIFALAC